MASGRSAVGPLPEAVYILANHAVFHCAAYRHRRLKPKLGRIPADCLTSLTWHKSLPAASVRKTPAPWRRCKIET